MVHCSALVIVFGGIHRDEHFQDHVGLWIENGNGGLGGEGLRISLYRDDVFVPCYRPKRPGRTIRLEVNRRFGAQTCKQIMPVIMLEHPGIGDIQILERHASIIGLGDVGWCIHNLHSILSLCISFIYLFTFEIRGVSR